MRKAIVTGAQGFIGRYLARELANCGWSVCGIGHGAWPDVEASRWGVGRWLSGEINRANLSLLQSEAGSPEVVFHLAGGASVAAAIQNPAEDFRKTVATTAALLEWVRVDSPNTAVIAVSSAAVYGSGHTGQISESVSSTPFSPYGYHKRMMEDFCASYAASFGIQSVIGRLFSVFGAGLKKQLLWDLCGRLSSGQNEITLGGTGDELRDWTDVRDVARALPFIADRCSGSHAAVNVGTGAATSVASIANHVADLWSARTGAARVAIKYSGVARPGDPFSLVANPTTLAQAGFRWQVDWQRGIADYVDWYLSRGRETE